MQLHVQGTKIKFILLILDSEMLFEFLVKVHLEAGLICILSLLIIFNK